MRSDGAPAGRLRLAERLRHDHVRPPRRPLAVSDAPREQRGSGTSTPQVDQVKAAATVAEQQVRARRVELLQRSGKQRCSYNTLLASILVASIEPSVNMQLLGAHAYGMCVCQSMEVP